MAYIAVVPPIRFINLTSPVGLDSDQRHPQPRSEPNDVLIMRAFMIYLQNFRADMQFTRTRLATLAGGMDSNLRQMILDYKAYKAKSMPGIIFEETGHDRVYPQDVKSALQSMSFGQVRTIMALNMDVRALADYGDTVIDVMCNLFPIREKLTVPASTGSALWDKARDSQLGTRSWRDLARNKVPWNAWLLKQQEAAMSDRDGALVRAGKSSGPKLPIMYDEDNELFALQAPYKNEMKAFYENHTRLALDTSPNPSAHGQSVTVKVSTTSYGGQTPEGAVKLWIVDRESLRIYGRAMLVTPARAQNLRLLNGSASFTIPELYSPRSPYFIIAEYVPSGSFLGSNAETKHEVK